MRVFEAVKDHLDNGRRVINHNNAKSSAVQLNALIDEVADDLGLEGKTTAKRKTVGRHLMALIGKSDGRLGYQDGARNGKVKASFFITEKGHSAVNPMVDGSTSK